MRLGSIVWLPSDMCCNALSYSFWHALRRVVSIAFFLLAAGNISLSLQAQGTTRLKPINVPPPPPPRAVERNRQLALNRIKRAYPKLNVPAMVRFYEGVAPDRIRALEAACLRGVRQAEPLVREMADHYTVLQTLKARSPEEYERIVQIEKLEGRARELGRKVRHLAAARGGKRNGENRDRLRIAKRDLAETIRLCFEGRQENQLIELNRLEAEVKELRQLLDTRNTHQDAVLAQRFAELSGEQMGTFADDSETRGPVMGASRGN